MDDDVTADSTTLTEATGLEEVKEAECIQDDNIEDHCSDSESEGDEDNEEDDFGAEDGEGGFLDADDLECETLFTSLFCQYVISP